MIDVGTNNEKLLKDPLCKILQYLFIYQTPSFVFTYLSYQTPSFYFTLWPLSNCKGEDHVASAINIHVF
jgi:hypothetical protein